MGQAKGVANSSFTEETRSRKDMTLKYNISEFGEGRMRKVQSIRGRKRSKKNAHTYEAMAGLTFDSALVFLHQERKD